jgi:hypothetical protein
MKSFHPILYIIGTLSVLAALYGWVQSGDFMDHYFGLFIGLTLIVTARLNQTGKLQ